MLKGCIPVASFPGSPNLFSRMLKRLGDPGNEASIPVGNNIMWLTTVIGMLTLFHTLSGCESKYTRLLAGSDNLKYSIMVVSSYPIYTNRAPALAYTTIRSNPPLCTDSCS